MSRKTAGKTMSRRQLLTGWREAWKEEDDAPQDRKGGSSQEKAEHAARLQQARDARAQGDLQTAVDLYRCYVKAHPQEVKPRRELGLCLYDLGQFIQARVEFERLAREPAPDSASLLYLGLCLLQLDRPARAAQAWQRFSPADEKQQALAALLEEQCGLLQQEPPAVTSAMQTVSRAAAEHVVS